MEKEALKQRTVQETESVNCPTCGSTWFEQVRYVRVKADHSVIPGQEVPPVEPGLPAYILLRCANCDVKLQPRTQQATFGHDVQTKSFVSFLDTVEGLEDTRKDRSDPEDRLAELEKKLLVLQETVNGLQSKGE